MAKSISLTVPSFIKAQRVKKYFISGSVTALISFAVVLLINGGELGIFPLLTGVLVAMGLSVFIPSPISVIVAGLIVFFTTSLQNLDFSAIFLNTIILSVVAVAVQVVLTRSKVIK